MLLLSIAVVLAGIIGFAAHRANLCTVLAMEEVLSTRRAFMLFSFVKAAMWVFGVTLIAAWVMPSDLLSQAGWQLSIMTVAGGFLFGIGATINGGCAFSTLTRLGGGNFGMLVSLAGFLAGAGIFGIAATAEFVPAIARAGMTLPSEGAWRLPVTLVALMWMTWELFRMARAVERRGWRKHLLSPHYRLSTAAMLMGTSNAILYALIGLWPYTRLFGQAANHVIVGSPPPLVDLWVLFLALIGGVGLSAWHSRRFTWQWRPQWQWVAFAIGGALMGLGAAMIPGGNDVLILHAIPSLSPHAVPAFVATLFGITMSLLAMRVFGQGFPDVDCGGDICINDPQK